MKKKRKKTLCLLLGTVMAVSVITSCSGPGIKYKMEKGIPLAYDNEIREGGIKDNDTYNHTLFYRNDTLLQNPDSQVLYVTDPKSTEFGYYYLYGTNAPNKGYDCFRSKDLNNWERMSTEKGFLAYEPVENCVVQQDFWAPEVIYDEASDQYYMFYSGSLKDSPGGKKYWCVAVADEPYGPFVPSTEDGLDATKVLIDPDKANAVVAEESRGEWWGIDPSPFIGADGEKYLFICRVEDPGDDGYDSIWGMRMNTWSSPDYSTLCQITSNGYLTTERTERALYEQKRTRNEGPHIYVREREDGTVTYYLTMSINDLNDYTVIQAVSDSPLGPYRKLTEEEGGILLANDNLSWDHIKGPGHHCFITVGEELYIVYHQQKNRSMGGSWIRCVAKDRIQFTENGNGQEVMVANGPTWSLQPQVEQVAEYKNIASEAKVSATKGSNVEALTDGLLSIYKKIEFVKEFESDKTTTITMDFGEYREITSLMIYNSKWYEKAFPNVARIEFDFKNDALPEGAMTYIEDLKFDWTSYKNANGDDMRPGGSAVAVFEPLLVKTIRITFELPIERPEELELTDEDGYVTDQTVVGVSEIVVLGK